MDNLSRQMGVGGRLDTVHISTLLEIAYRTALGVKYSHIGLDASASKRDVRLLPSDPNIIPPSSPFFGDI